MRNQGVAKADHERARMLPHRPIAWARSRPAKPEAVASSINLRVESLPRSQPIASANGSSQMAQSANSFAMVNKTALGWSETLIQRKSASLSSLMSWTVLSSRRDSVDFFDQPQV